MRFLTNIVISLSAAALIGGCAGKAKVIKPPEELVTKVEEPVTKVEYHDMKKDGRFDTKVTTTYDSEGNVIAEKMESDWNYDKSIDSMVETITTRKDGKTTETSEINMDMDKNPSVEYKVVSVFNKNKKIVEQREEKDTTSDGKMDYFSTTRWELDANNVMTKKIREVDNDRDGKLDIRVVSHSMEMDKNGRIVKVTEETDIGVDGTVDKIVYHTGERNEQGYLVKTVIKTDKKANKTIDTVQTTEMEIDGQGRINSVYRTLAVGSKSIVMFAARSLVLMRDGNGDALAEMTDLDFDNGMEVDGKPNYRVISMYNARGSSVPRQVLKFDKEGNQLKVEQSDKGLIHNIMKHLEWPLARVIEEKLQE